ncbi:VlpB-type protein (plasmid) [Borrelia turicatae 91E135]|uniref:Variable large protein n=1 Tax=Borrelia turicatae (strain 91E135) TaxID=314724 RepID=A0ABF7R054_BORT9|nr:VlpB-type protein [Borrelia turicatae 91E135]
MGFTAVKSGDKRSKVGEHFKTIGDGLTTTKNKLNELSSKISEAKNADGSTIEAVKGAIKGANDVFERLIAALTTLADTAKEAGNTDIGDAITDNNAVGADEASVKAIIESVKTIIDLADKSGIEIKPGNFGEPVANGDGPKALIHNAQAGAGDAAKLAGEVSKADPWAMIDKIKNSKDVTASAAPAAGDDAGKLATGSVGAANDNGTAATNADLAAAVGSQSND